MNIVDILMTPADSFWRKRCRDEERMRRRAEANERYATAIREQQEQDLAALTRRDFAQAKAIEAYNNEIASLNVEIERLTHQNEQKDMEIKMLRECLKSERDAKDALRINSKLWQNIKREVVGDVHA